MMIQIPNFCQFCCGLLATYPNIYLIMKSQEGFKMTDAKNMQGSSAGTIEEETNYICQKCCYPAARAYKATINSPMGGSYRVDRPCTLGSWMMCKFCQPTVKVYNGDTHIGSVTQVCCPAYLCIFEVDLHMGTEIDDSTRKMKIKKCGINAHTCCATPLCGLIGKELEFEIYDGSGQPKNDVSLKKVHSHWCVECCSAGDLYKFKLPNNADEAAVFLAAV